MKRSPLVLLGLVAACANIWRFQAGELEDVPSDAFGGEGGVAAGIAAGGLAVATGKGGGGASIPHAAGAPDIDTAGGAAGSSCGNGRLDGSEMCDGDELGDATCTTAGDLAGGRLRCDAECEYDLEECYSVESVAMGDHACAVLSNGKLKCWGRNFYGELGLGDKHHRGEESGEMGAELPFVPLGEARARQVTVGARHTCVLTTNNEVRCWGDNFYGQLGIPDVELLTSAAQAPAVDFGSGTVEHIQAGLWQTCVLLASGKVKCWGDNDKGQLGLGDILNRGKQAGDLGEQLAAVDFGAGPVEQLSIGDDHACALGPWGVKCWGGISYRHPMPDDASQYALGDEPNEMGTRLPLIDLGWSAASVASGGMHNCARSTEGSVKCWGDGSMGQLGYGDTQSYLDLARFGAELGEVALDGSALALSAGLAHTCALLTDNRLKCWGSNQWGQLGLSDMAARGYRTNEMGALLPAVDLGKGHNIVGIQAGADASCAILDKGRLKCWGRNDYGALGLGHSRDIGDGPEEMGDALPFVQL